MKNFPAICCLYFFLSSCTTKDTATVDPAFADSLINHFTPTQLAITTDNNLAFWKKRMDSLPDNYVNGPKYASVLSSRFHLYGNIKDLLKADSLMKCSNEANQQKDPGIFRTLASFALLQHQFQQADSFLEKAVQIEGHTIPNTYLDFDIAFETGQYAKAGNLLKSLEKDKAYAWYFRKSKYDHYDGSLDSSIRNMQQAASKAADNKYLKQIALSNAADLSIHKGDLSAAYNLYRQSIKIDATDFHSIMGIGWIALVHDKNDTLAEKIFQFVHQHHDAPDALLKLNQVAEARGDIKLQQKYAGEFAKLASDKMYGNMYNKYLIDLYTGILNNPGKAVLLAEQETYSRPTPQVYAWYAWSLFCNNQKEKADEIFKGFVSQKPLEALELYYMGKMMQGLQKGFNAQQFFKAAYKNRYDLSPAKVKDLKEISA